MQAASGTGDPLFVENVFSTFLYTGTGSSAQTITNNIDLTEGGLVWVKHRSLAASHILTDSKRGVQYLRSDTNDAQINQSLITDFVSTGFTANGDSVNYANDNGEDYVSWTFRKAPKFFDVVTYTGNDSNRTISHDLGTAPGMILIKDVTQTGNDWIVYHRSLANTKFLNLNQSYAASTDAAAFNSTTATSTEFSLGNKAQVNTNGNSYVAYLFGHNNNDGDYGDNANQDIIKCGSFTDSSSGFTVDLGFEPQWLFTKRTDSTGNWEIVDNMRGFTVDRSYTRLYPNLTNAEQTVTKLGINSQGFFSTTAMETNGATIIYMAIRRGPMATPETASSVFAIDEGDGVGAVSAYTSGFPVDFAIDRTATSTSPNYVATRLLQGTRLQTDGTNVEASESAYYFDYMEGWRNFARVSGNYSWMWKRAPGYHDVVAYTGDDQSTHNIDHNLGVAPEMIWIKRRDGTQGVRDWSVYHKDVYGAGGVDGVLTLNNNVAREDLSIFGTPSTTQFTVKTSFGTVNSSSGTYIAYLFATLAGVSKVGSVTHSGTTNVDCGFSSGASLVMLKRTDASGDWFWWDSTRGIVSGNDPYMVLNDSAAQVTNTDFIDPLSSGFTITDDFTDGDYIFYAIAA
jgi:hypothetical protein